MDTEKLKELLTAADCRFGWEISSESPNIIKHLSQLVGSTSGHPDSGFFPSVQVSYANAALIVAAVNALPSLLAEIEAARRDALRCRAALLEAAQSLSTIANGAGRMEYMDDMTQVRGYANSRATAAHTAMEAQP